jgi:elongation factor G
VAVQPLLDNVLAYLTTPAEREVVAHDTTQPVSALQVELVPAAAVPLVALAFKLEGGQFRQLAYMRVYHGTWKEGQLIFHGRLGKSIKVPKLVHIHSNEMEVFFLPKRVRFGDPILNLKELVV